MLTERAATLVRQLQHAGVGHMLRIHNGVVGAHGETMLVDGHGISGTDANRLLEALADGLPAAVTVRFADHTKDSPALLESLCAQLRALLVENSIDVRSVELVIDGVHTSPQAALLIRQRYLGAGPLKVLVDGHLPQRRWLELWHMRDGHGVSTAIPAPVRSPCPLLSAETGDAIVPGIAINVPAGSAWVPMRVDLSDYADRHGSLCTERLERALVTCVEIGDRLHDVCNRPLATSRHDAWFNRRLAIEVAGAGELARLRGIDPHSHDGLEELREVMRTVRRILRRSSSRMARLRGNVPSLKQSDPTRRLPAGASRDDWRLRWRDAVSSAAIRHRNLVSMSPWSLFSPTNKADFRFADLLPLIAEADVISYRREVSLDHWNVNEFREFHQRTRAILQKQLTNMVFAERV